MIITPTESSTDDFGNETEQDEEEDADDEEDREITYGENVNNNTSGTSKDRAKTHIITRSRSTSDLCVCDLDDDPTVNERRSSGIGGIEVLERVQSNPEYQEVDAPKQILSSSTPSLKSLRDGRRTGLRSNFHLQYERFGSVPYNEDPYHKLLTNSAEKVLEKLKSRQQLVSSQEQTFVPKSSPKPFYASNAPRKLKPLFSEEEIKMDDRTEQD